jgi:hypothetical protein
MSARLPGWQAGRTGEWMNAATRAITTCMHPTDPDKAGFKRQVVFRIGADDWPALEAAAKEHGSIQAAVLAGIHALTKPEPPAQVAKAKAEPKPATKPKPASTPASAATKPTAPPVDLEEEIRARDAAKLLSLKTSTISGYIRTGRMPGRYDDSLVRGPNSDAIRGWVTTRRAVEDYRARLMKRAASAGN